MKPAWEKLYQALLEAIEKVVAGELTLTGQVAECYYLSHQYWLQLKELYLSEKAHAITEQISFFKEVKPKFTSRIEYYMLLNQSLLFIPENPLLQLEYWHEQTKRPLRFRERHWAFISYYESGSSDKDSEWFCYNPAVLYPQEQMYDDYDCRSSHDHLVRGLLAHQLFEQYVVDYLQKLANDH